MHFVVIDVTDLYNSLHYQRQGVKNTMDYTKEFGRYVKAYRKHAGLSQEELAEKCDMSTRQICNIETGRSEPKLTAISRICFNCGFEFDKFLKENIPLFQPKLL